VGVPGLLDVLPVPGTCTLIHLKFKRKKKKNNNNLGQAFVTHCKSDYRKPGRRSYADSRETSHGKFCGECFVNVHSSARFLDISVIYLMHANP
jgi:hypothetical protein